MHWFISYLNPYTKKSTNYYRLSPCVFQAAPTPVLYIVLILVLNSNIVDIGKAVE